LREAGEGHQPLRWQAGELAARAEALWLPAQGGDDEPPRAEPRLQPFELDVVARELQPRGFLEPQRVGASVRQGDELAGPALRRVPAPA
jgi:hypothetical protein